MVHGRISNVFSDSSSSSSAGKLKRIVADLSLDKVILQDVIGRKF